MKLPGHSITTRPLTNAYHSSHPDDGTLPWVSQSFAEVIRAAEVQFTLIMEQDPGHSPYSVHSTL